MKIKIVFLSFLLVKGERRFRKKTFGNRVLRKMLPDKEPWIEEPIPLIRQRSFTSDSYLTESRETKKETGCQKPRIALGNGAALSCPIFIGDRDRCRYRCPKGFILKPGSNNVIGKNIHKTIQELKYL